MQRGHSGSTRERSCAALERSEDFFKRTIRRVAITGVRLALHFLAENLVQLLGVVVERGGRSIDGCDGRDSGSRLFAVADMHGLGFDFHLRFQRTPSLVSSIMM